MTTSSKQLRERLTLDIRTLLIQYNVSKALISHSSKPIDFQLIYEIMGLYLRIPSLLCKMARFKHYASIVDFGDITDSGYIWIFSIYLDRPGNLLIYCDEPGGLKNHPEFWRRQKSDYLIKT